MKTAVEWLEIEFKKIPFSTSVKSVFEIKLAPKDSK